MTGKYALIIANTEYNDPGLSQLSAPGKDAEEFARVLKSPDICAFDEVKVILNENESVVREAIDDFFYKKKPEDLLVIYFSGHGIRDEVGSLYLAVKNTNRFKLRVTAIRSDFIREVMNESRSKRQVLILDCCNSGAFEQGTKAATGISIGTAIAFEGGFGRIVLTASDATQFAWEGEKIIGETGESLFTHYLINGLEGEADINSDGYITVDELYDYAYEKVKLATPNQTPSKFSSKQQGEIILRQNIRIEDTRPISLPDDLSEEIEDPRPYVREAAVQKLERIIRGKNLGMARSAQKALEEIATNDDSKRVSKVAIQVLETLGQEALQTEEAKRLSAQKAEEEQKAEDAKRLAAQKAEEERKAEDAKRFAAQKAEEEQKAKDAKRLAAQKAEEERKAEDAKRLAAQKVEEERRTEEAKRLAAQKAEEERRTEEAKRLKTEKAKKVSSYAIPAGISVIGILGLLVLIIIASTLSKPSSPSTQPTSNMISTESISSNLSTVPPTVLPTDILPTPVRFHSPDTSNFTVAESEIAIDTLDPALAYDTASGEIIQNVYETLVFYDGEKTDAFVPMLAESWDVSADGTTYTFHIRQGVKFHEGQDLTASDVAYSFQRGLLQGGYASPQWLLAEPFFGVGNDDITMIVDEGASADDREALKANDPAALKAACEKVQAAIVADDAAGTVTMTLAQPWGPFLATIAQSWGSVMSKSWVVEKGGWDGTCDTWQDFYGMISADDPFSTIANGTGPFKLEKFANGEEIDLVRNDAYWREPAKLERVVLKQVPEWGTRFSMMQAGDADLATVPSANRSQMDELVGSFQVYDAATNTYGPIQEVCSYDAGALGAAKFTPCAAGETGNGGPFLARLGRPGISMDVLLYNWKIASDSPYIGTGTLNGNGIPADFFSDVHIRKGFSYAFDFDTLLNDVFSGEAVQSYQLTLPGMPGFFPDTPHYSYDLDKAAEEFKLADVDKDGIPAGKDPYSDVWTTGFRFQLAYNVGNSTRQTIAEILAGSLAEINELFVVETLGLPWPAYLRAQSAKQIPIMTGGWLEDIHDPHNWYQPYTTGTYGGRQSLPDDVKAQFKDILNRGVAETDPAKRAEIYKEANQLYYDLAVALPLEVTTSHGFSQRWVQGVILNPIFPGNYYYTIYKD